MFRVGEVHGRITRRVEELRDMVGRIDSAKTTTNLWGERWAKLCQNGMKNGVSAATGLTGSDCDRNDAIRRFSIKLDGEAVRVGQALGYRHREDRQVGARDAGQGVGGRQDRARRGRDDPAAGLQHQPQPARRHPAPVDGPGHPQGRRTEIEFMNGYVADRGNYIGVPAPTHAKLTEIVKKVERQEVKAAPALLGG